MSLSLLSRLSRGATAGVRSVKAAGGPGEILQQAATGIPATELNSLQGLNAAVPGGILTGLIGRDLLSPVREAQTDRFDEALRGMFGQESRMQERYRLEKDLVLQDQAQRIRQEQLQERITRRIAHLAATNPQLYNEVSSGRRLPRGAQVFGGRKRSDLLEQLALRAEG